jgi:surfeit locus 1 family protein
MTDQPQKSGSGLHEAEPRVRSFTTLLVLGACALLVFAGLLALGTWQVQRLQWKNALIERVEQRVHSAPVPVPGPERWSEVSAETDEYRRVRVTGTFLHELSTRVQALTALGSGYWILTPLQTADGNVVLINRGFIPAGSSNGKDRHSYRGDRPGKNDVSTVTGLLRMSEPGGGFLRRNDPANNRWYSRDVQAIAEARGLSRVAPYFVDASANREAAVQSTGNDVPAGPVSGLTVISFNNNHLIYALTWYALALMVAGACFWVWRDERRMRRRRIDVRAEHRAKESEDGK